MKSKRWTSQLKLDAVILIGSGLTQKQVGAHFGVTGSRISSVIWMVISAVRTVADDDDGPCKSNREVCEFAFAHPDKAREALAAREARMLARRMELEAEWAEWKQRQGVA